MIDPNKILGQLLDSPAKQGFAGGMAGGLLSSLLVSKSGRKMGKKALKYGAVAAVGAIAYNAWRNHQAAKAPQSGAAGAAPPPTPVEVGAELPPQAAGFLPPAADPAATASLGMTLIRAMVAAARADGKLDPAESQTIFARLEESDLTPEEKGALVNEISRPVSVDALAEAAKSPQEAMEVYVASLLAIEVDTPAEKAYLSLLAARLGLEEELVRQIHAQVASA